MIEKSWHHKNAEQCSRLERRLEKAWDGPGGESTSSSSVCPAGQGRAGGGGRSLDGSLQQSQA